MINDFHIDCKEIRKLLIKSLHNAKSGHPGSSLSIIEILNYIYKFDNNFKLVLSKGHAVPALYSVMNFYKILDDDQLLSLRKVNSKTQGHPDRSKFDKIDCSTGALGQGLSVAIGYAIASKLQNKNNNIYCILGDGELQEGQIWEAAMYLGANFFKNLLVIVDNNKFQNEDLVEKTLPMGNLAKKFDSFGFQTIEIDGHDFSEIDNAFKIYKTSSKPILILANTVKGKGISFMENSGKWHGSTIDDESFNNAMKELNE